MRRAPVAKLALGRSLGDFLPLLPGEQALMLACRQGEMAVLGTSVPDESDEPLDTLQIRAAFLRFLLLGGDGQAPVHERGVQLVGAYVTGRLDLGGCRIPHNVGLQRCRFAGLLFAQDARVEGLMSLQGSHLSQGLHADRLRCEGGLFLRAGFRATGEVRLLSAQIGGDLECGGGRFEVQDGNALWAERAVVQGSVFFKSGFKAIGAVRLLGAQIGGNLECRDGQFEVQDGDALSADGAVVKGDVNFKGGFKATGHVRLLGAQIGGDLACSGGRFVVQDGDALSVDRAVVQGGVFFDEGFKATGQVRLLGAQIGSNLSCGGGQFEDKDGDALMADRAVVQGSMFFNGSFKATGKVRLQGAQIGGSLSCGGGQFEGKDGDALLADGAVVQGSVFFNGGFRATGKVRLQGAQIGSNLECGDGRFEVKNGDALLLERAVVKGAWHFSKLKAPVCVNAGHMQVAVLADAVDSWAAGSVLDGLRYGALGGRAPTQGKARLAWLQKQRTGHLGERDDSDDFRPQPWRHLQHVLREMGHAEDARQIGIAFEQQRYKIKRVGQSPHGTWAPMAWSRRGGACTAHALFGWLSGYGYRPMRLVAWMVLVWLVCAACYWCLALPPHNAIGPSDPLVFQHQHYAACTSGGPVATAAAAGGAPHARNWYLCADLPAEYSTFSPLAFSLDLLLPLVDLGQDKAWGALISTPKANWWEELFTVSCGHVVRWLVWFQTLFGWVASLLLVGIASGFARRSEE